MNNEEEISLYSFKKQHSIDDESNHELSMIFDKIYTQFYQRRSEEFYESGHYNSNRFDPFDKFETEDLEVLFNRASKTSETLIPYANFTNTIFSVGYHYTIYSDYVDSSFPEELQAAMENHVIKKFGMHRNKDEESGKEYIDVERPDDNIIMRLDVENKNGLKVFYKIIQHTQLALAQRESLYINQKQDINDQREQIEYISDEIHKSNRRYNNMISNFISILGIFAAIMVATFGGIQGFTALFTNESHHTLTEIFLISAFGLFSLISIIFLLFYSISKLVEKDIEDIYHGETFLKKYPIYSHTLLVTGFLFLFALTHHIKLNKPGYLPEFLIDNMWATTITALFIMVLCYYVLFVFRQNEGGRHINVLISDRLMKFKNRVGLEPLVTGVLIIPIVVAVLGVLILWIISF